MIDSVQRESSKAYTLGSLKESKKTYIRLNHIEDKINRIFAAEERLKTPESIERRLQSRRARLLGKLYGDYKVIDLFADDGSVKFFHVLVQNIHTLEKRVVWNSNLNKLK